MWSGSNFVIVPWFSRKEWFNVYHSAYSNDVSKWKEARDTMLVWQARVSKLPIGVDLTLPLLQAKVVDADPFVDSDVKSIMQGTALQRFVSSVVKLPQSNYYSAQTLHTLATEIGLPGHLVDLRNEIIHGDSGWFGGCTVSEALETAYAWVKDFYWSKEVKQMSLTNQARDSLKHDPDWKYFLKMLDCYAMTFVNRNLVHSKAAKTVAEGFEAFFSTNPHECIEALTTRVLMPVNIPERRFKRPCIPGKKPVCNCFFKISVMQALSPVLKSILKVEKVAEHLINHLVTKALENRKIAIEWIYLLIGYLAKLPPKNSARKGSCKKHILQVEESDVIVDWKSIVTKLLSTEEDWATDLAIRLMQTTNAGYSKSQVEQVKNLLKLLKSDGEDPKKPTQKINSKINYVVYGIDSVLEAVSKHDTSSQQLIEKLNQSLVLSTIGITTSSDSRTPLGVLPCQKHNKQLYKELLLHYPEDRSREPPLKRKKT